ncbi:MAG: hypothetical protein ABI883_07210, partial [Chthoniobacterales bacterium]
MKWPGGLAIGALVLLAHATLAQITVPIYLEDSHAGSFYWLAQEIDLEEPVTLLHFDAHSDASAIFDSDAVRTQLRRVGSRAERKRLLTKWRERGVVQCFNWIEPLMPAPIARVIWVRGERADEENAKLGAEAGDFLDGHLEAAPRRAGSLRERISVRGLEELEQSRDLAGPLLVSIDLDYFAGVPAPERAAAFERVWKFVVERRNLRGITFAISRPYLASDDEADALVQLALEAALSLPTARIRF